MRWGTGVASTAATRRQARNRLTYLAEWLSRYASVVV